MLGTFWFLFLLNWHCVDHYPIDFDMTEQRIISEIHLLPENQRLKVLDFIVQLKQSEEQGNTKKGKRIFGVLKGTFKMSKDFDSPLEDFKDYM